MRAIFGELWDAPVCDDAWQVDTPIGETCMWCGEDITEGDQGFMTPSLRPTTGKAVTPAAVKVRWESELLASHRECDLLHVMGHSYGLCGCTGYQDMTERQAGIELWRQVNTAR